MPFCSSQEKTDHVKAVSDQYGMLSCREKQQQKKKTEQAQATPPADPVAG